MSDTADFAHSARMPATPPGTTPDILSVLGIRTFSGAPVEPATNVNVSGQPSAASAPSAAPAAATPPRTVPAASSPPSTVLVTSSPPSTVPAASSPPGTAADAPATTVHDLTATARVAVTSTEQLLLSATPVALSDITTVAPKVQADGVAAVPDVPPAVAAVPDVPPAVAAVPDVPPAMVNPPAAVAGPDGSPGMAAPDGSPGMAAPDRSPGMAAPDAQPAAVVPPPAVQGAQAAPTGKATGTPRALASPGIFALEFAYLIAILATAVAYSATTAASVMHQLFPLTLFGLVPVAIPWFGALGAVVIGLYGIFDHKTDWDSSYVYWHIARPITGAVLGMVGYLIFHAIVQTAGGPTTASNAVVYDIVAFLIGYREQTFKLLIKRATDLILGPGTAPAETGGQTSTNFVF